MKFKMASQDVDQNNMLDSDVSTSNSEAMFVNEVGLSHKTLVFMLHGQK